MATSTSTTLPIIGPPRFRGGGAFLGDATIDPTYDPTTPAYLAWQADVKARGGVVTVMPAPPGSAVNTQTPPAARFPNGSGGWRYEIAPVGIVTADTFQRYKNAITIAVGKGAAVGEGVAKAIASAPQNAIASLTGIPKWLVPGVLVVGGGLLLMHYLGLKPPKIFAANPRGRRRRGRHASRAAHRRRRG